MKRAHPIAERSLRRAMVGASALGLTLAVLAVGAAGSRGPAEQPVGTAAPLMAVAFLLGAAVVGILAALVAAVYALWPEGPVYPPEASLSRLALRTAAFVVVMLLVVYLGALVLQERGVELPELLPGSGPPPPPEAASPATGRFPWLLTWLGALVTATVLLVVAGRESITRRADPVPAALAPPLPDVLDRLIAELVTGEDPRSRVIAVYAQMVEDFAARGHPPRASEAPGEYLERVLPVLGGGGAAARHLLQLYELARFSPHPIDRDVRGRSLRALRALRRELVGS